MGRQFCDDYLYNPSASSTAENLSGITAVTVSNPMGDFDAYSYNDYICVDKEGTMCSQYQFYAVQDAQQNAELVNDVEGLLGLAPKNIDD